MRFLSPALAVTLLFGACSASEDDDGGEDGWEKLVSYSWDVAPGEIYYCVRQTIDHDIVMDGIEAMAPLGTHHTVLSWGDPDGPDGRPDGVQECISYDHQFEGWLFQSSHDPGRFTFPPGFAGKIPAGKQISLNFHIYNTSDSEMTGETGIRIHPADPANVEHYATVAFMGKVSLSVPEGVSTQTGQCELPADLTLISANPHMHSHATHQTVVAHSSMVGDQTVLDTDFDYDESMYFRPIEPEVPMKQGDIVDVQCTYNNDTGGILPWGQDGWTAEMCWSMIYVYPAESLLSAPCAN